MSSDRRIEALLNAAAELGPQIAQHQAKAGSLDAFDKYAEDPAGFFRDVLHIPRARFEHLLPIMDAVRDRPLVAVRSSNGWGKDWVAARLSLWHVYARRGLVLVSGPTERQVKTVVMGEVRRAFLGAPRLPGTLHELALKVPSPESIGIIAMTSTEASKLSGFHAPRLMIVLTEAQALEEFAWEGMLACATGEDSKVLAVGNPLRASGKFFEVHRAGGWHSIALSAFDHPNLLLKREVIVGAVTQTFCDMIASEYGLGSGIYRARVLGEWPDSDDDALCRRSWLELAAQRWEGRGPEGVPALPAWGVDSMGRPRELEARNPVRVAVDPARFGSDQTAMCIAAGTVVRELVTWAHLDTMETAGRVIVEIRQRNLDPKTTTIVIDEPGLGAGVIDRLREVGCRRVEAFNGGKTALKAGQFLNRRAETYWALRRLLEEGQIAIPRDAKLWDELCATRWRPNSRGQVMLESKDDLKARLGRSPDRADAVAMALARAPASSIVTVETWRM